MVKKTYSLPDRIEIANQFGLYGDVYMVTPYGGGHINDTYSVESKVRSTGDVYGMVRYILQRIDTNIFTRPEQMMGNIQLVTEAQHESIRARGGDRLREALTLIKTNDGKTFYWRNEDEPATFWRCYYFLEGMRTYDSLEDTPTGRDRAYQAARAFGNFQLQLAELPGTKLVETIDNFHHTPTRIQQLEDAIRINHEGRADVCKAEIEFARSIYSVASAFVDGMANGTILIRVSHNDTKINNVMFDFTGPEEIAMVVIDLDTVMPGTMLYDFGDLVRTSTWPGREDEPDPSKVYVSMALFEELVKGWSRSVGHIMTPAEIDNMALSGKIITYNIGIRFLADYFRGDTYFNIQRPDQNLERARVQFAMIQSMDKQRNEMEEIVRKHASKI